MEFAPGRTVGIDLGTTFSSIAYLNEQGEPVPIKNEDDELETPSLILLLESGHVIVGPSRQRAAMEDPDRVVERIKRHMGSEYKRTFDGQEITPEFLSALILKKLIQDASKRIGKIGNAVITVPYYFNDQRRKATQDAGRIAGLNVIDIINEPTAATLAYAWQHGHLGRTEGGKEERLCLVYDLGGGTFDVTLVRYTPTHFRVLATDGDVLLGGLDWTDRLAEYVAKEFQDKYQLNPLEDPKAAQILRNDCEVAKLALSEENQVSITCRYQQRTLTVPVTREQFESMTADLLQRTIDTLHLVLDEANVEAKDLDAVVLVGGSTLMPRVRQAVQEATGKEPDRSLSPYTAVAQGAAIHAAILEAKHRGRQSAMAEIVRKRLSSVREENVNSHGLGIVVRDPKRKKYVNHVMIPKNSPLPVKIRRVFHTAHENQQRINIKVTEGDAPDPKACSLIGNCYITDLPPGLPKGAPVEISYAFDTAGRVRVRAKDLTSGQEAAIEIQRRVGLTEEQVDAYTRLAAEYTVE